MTSLKTDLEVDLDAEGVEEAMLNMMRNGTLTPWKVVVDVPYAKYVEFGTGPANPNIRSPKYPHQVQTAKGPKTIQCTDVFWRMYEWVLRTFPDKKDPYAYAYKLYKDTMEYGMPPRPFVRPVLHEVERDFNKLLKEKGNLEGVARELADRIADNLLSHRFPQSAQSSTGEMASHIRVLPVMESEVGNSDDIRPEVWASDTCDYNGEERTERGK